MKRKIKFRAYNELACYPMSGMLEVTSINFDDGIVGVSNGSRQTIAHLHEIKLMQSTGIFDLFDREIFEGDILEKYYTSHDQSGKERHNKIATFEVKWDDYHATFTIACGKTHFYKVIGNVYQNADLLK